MPRGENRSSVLLSREENEQVFSLIGPKCQSLATAVVQLFTTEDPSHSKWKKKDTGVLCLIKDNAKRSYFFRIYCLYRRAMIWEQEVYLQIEYKNPRPFLHTFEAEEYMAAFNFANENEADILRNILLEKIELRKIRREERRQRQSIGAGVARSSGSGNGVARHNGAVQELEPPPLPPQQPPPQAQPRPSPSPQMFPPKTNNALGTYTLKNNKKLKRGKLTKEDIGMPLDFKHVSHVGWDANKGFDLDKAPNADELRSFFSKAGVSEIQLQDQETREFIYDFIESHGGLDAVKEDLHNVKLGLPPPPAAAAPPVPSRGAAPPHPPHPPAPPSRAPPPPPARAPPAHRAAPPRPAQPASSGPPSVPPPPPPGAAPPPPPPPAPASTGAPPPPPPPAPPAPPPAPLAPPAPPAPPPMDAGPDPRSALMESIRSGSKTLRRVEAAPKPAAVEDGRSNLLSEIRQGIELRPVSRSDSSSGGRGGSGGGGGGGGGSGLAEALQRALEERSRAIHSDSDDDMSDATTSDGEWDD
ncbi:unnamed protein product [Arctia plantaginis]|uniref:Neural Wiskott-Aldrich syndrome protein n=1 Tax=Arctia plantaginis TaxID=874455 RepID=A0A8S1ADJ3_ARCPL|nr:unnamed protein product [Arctia plantaginis]